MKDVLETTRLQVRRFIKAPCARVFEAWTRPELMKQWFSPGPMTTPDAQSDLKSGGAYKVVMRQPDGVTFTAVGVYKEIVPDKKLVFTWGWEGGGDMGGRQETLVTLEFSEKDGGTELTLTHERFAAAEETKKHLEGWNGCLDKLAAWVK